MIAVTGATGALGGLVAHRLADLGIQQRLICRRADRAPALADATVTEAAYADGGAMKSALDGAATLFLVSGREAADRLDQHKTAIDAAVRAGVERVVYTSFFGAASNATFTLARQHWYTEEHIRASGLRFVFLRDNLYLDVLPYFPGPDGVIRAPAGHGRFSGVAREDIAGVATAVLLDDKHDGKTYRLTGPENLNLDDVAAILGQATGRAISYQPETEEEAYTSRAVYNAPAFEVEGWVSSYLAIAAGEMETVTHDVESVSGRPPLSLEEFLTAQPDSYQHLI